MFQNPHKVPTVLAWRDAVDLLHLWTGKGTTVWAGTGVLLRSVLPAWNHPHPWDALADSNKPQTVWMELSWLCA